MTDDKIDKGLPFPETIPKMPKTKESRKKLRPSVQWFAEQMEEKLRKHDDDYGKDGWLDPYCSFMQLKRGFNNEIIEFGRSLNQYIFNDSTCAKLQEDAIKECADVANFAMMIADKIRRG